MGDSLEPFAFFKNESAHDDMAVRHNAMLHVVHVISLMEASVVRSDMIPYLKSMYIVSITLYSSIEGFVWNILRQIANYWSTQYYCFPATILTFYSHIPKSLILLYHDVLKKHYIYLKFPIIFQNVWNKLLFHHRHFIIALNWLNAFFAWFSSFDGSWSNIDSTWW